VCDLLPRGHIFHSDRNLHSNAQGARNMESVLSQNGIWLNQVRNWLNYPRRWLNDTMIWLDFPAKHADNVCNAQG
jgi:hypothetical protein